MRHDESRVSGRSVRLFQESLVASVGAAPGPHRMSLGVVARTFTDEVFDGVIDAARARGAAVPVGAGTAGAVVRGGVLAVRRSG